MERVNLYSAKVPRDDDDPPGYETGYVRLGPLLGATMLGATIYEMPPGQSLCPYHYEYGNEEWLIVLSGRPALRHPDGETEVEPGDVVCFPVGPSGAHKVTNSSDETVRVLLLSTKIDPAMTVYPDSDKIAAWPGPPGDKIDHVMVRRESHVDYWDREP